MKLGRSEEVESGIARKLLRRWEGKTTIDREALDVAPPLHMRYDASQDTAPGPEGGERDRDAFPGMVSLHTEHTSHI